jgi:tetratricopeptide (TPR) repeat protein
MKTGRLEQLQKMLLDEPEDDFLNYALALEYHKLGEALKAISIIEKLLDRNPSYLGGYYQLGKWYEEQQEMQKAGEIFEKGIAVAKQQNNRKALNELNEALQNNQQ